MTSSRSMTMSRDDFGMAYFHRCVTGRTGRRKPTHSELSLKNVNDRSWGRSGVPSI